MPHSAFITIGKIGKTHGIHGWLKLHSFTEPQNNIFDYLPWHFKQGQEWQVLNIQDKKQQGDDLLIKVVAYDNPETARILTNAEIAVSRDRLPELSEDEVYWADLEGLTVVNQQGETLGLVDYLFETPANDVMVVAGEKQYLIPYVSQQYILAIDWERRVITVAWEKDWV